ncbi:hypothetical protein PNOK_0025700 [Pyrrhoderma noxium]|uniref:Uncharacterized protein n=1 Tax=Pyrrhoderma noxium TaxID=2282107 RepID=A0A286UUC5_9AGAM|nr:hypothetical protein PNOK_0025700 [Pyrrhoderma noxium]
MLALRVYAIYNKKILFLVILVIFTSAQFALGLGLYLTPGSQIFTDNTTDILYYTCYCEPSRKTGRWQYAYQIMQLVYDLAILAFIAVRIIPIVRSSKLLNLTFGRTILNNSLQYFTVLFTSYLTWVLMIELAEDPFKYAAAIPTLVLSCTMANRITISLLRPLEPTFDNDNRLQGYKGRVADESEFIFTAVDSLFSYEDSKDQALLFELHVGRRAYR